MEKIFLLADDDSDDTLLFCDALKEIDPSIICYCAANGKQVFEILRNTEIKNPQIIFLDINMPGMNGWECLKQLKDNEEYRLIPVVTYSTSSHQKEASIALNMGAICFFTKPNYFMELKDILNVFANNINGNLFEAISQVEAIKSNQISAGAYKNATS